MRESTPASPLTRLTESVSEGAGISCSWAMSAACNTDAVEASASLAQLPTTI
ncbi:hypothetical protein ABZ646_24970 [Streptomyces sp. NPDC007162]|uniref:hypothetical protein n=1 Tax=Streptomyces sp. NPDC007162 TaxID=3156917 RepID=UPI0033DB5B8A